MAVRVTLTTGRQDVVVSTDDNGDLIDRVVPEAGIAVRGRFAHVARGGASDSWAYLVDGETLVADKRLVKCAMRFSGALTATHRVEAGAEFDAFETALPLPDDGSLNGRTLMVDVGGLLVQGFRIGRVERIDGRTLIHTPDEPGMTITDNRVKLNYYPGWGVQGEARFHIAGSALWLPKTE